MTNKFTHFLKVFGITTGIFFGSIALYLGIVFLITGFKPKVIELKSLKFSQDEYFFSDKDENGEDVKNVTIMVVSEPEDTTQTQVEITFLKGVGHDVVGLPVADGEDRCIVNVNEPIPLELKRDESGNAIGGEAQIRAISIDDKGEMRNITANCSIYIDIPVSSFDVVVTKGEEKAEIVTGTGEDATKIFPGYELDCSIKQGSVFPEGSLQPFSEIYKRQITEKDRKEFIRNDEKRIFWESSDTTRATVDTEGKVRIVPTAAPGEVTITGRIYRTYEVQDNHKTLFDFEYDVNIAQEDAVPEYEKYLERITAIKSVTLKIRDMDVAQISVPQTKTTSVSGFHYNVNVNESATFYLDGDMQNSLGLSIDPEESATESFTSEDLRYKLSCIFVVPSYAQGSVTGYQNGNDCLQVSTIMGNLDSGYYFNVRALYPQEFTEKATCLIVGLGVWNDETQSLEKNADGSYVLAKDIDGNDINTITVHLEITTKEAELIAVSSSKEKYTDIAMIPDQVNLSVDVGATVELDAYMRYTNSDGNKVTVNGKAGKLTNELTYSMVAFFVPEGTDCIGYDDTYCIDLGQKWYPIGASPIIDCYTEEILTNNSIITCDKTGKFTVIAVLLRTDADGRVLLVDENNRRPVDENGNVIDPANYKDYQDSLTLYYDYTIKSGTQEVGGAGQVNNFTVTVSSKFNTQNLVVQHKYGDLEYETLSAQNNNLNQIYINDGSSNDYVYILIHYNDESVTENGQGVLQSAFILGNFELISGDAFAEIDKGLTNDGEKILTDDSGQDILYIMGKMGNTQKPITVKMVLNGEIIFNYTVSITDQKIEKLYLKTNARTEEGSSPDLEKITVTVDPSDQNTNANWSVKSYNEETQSTTTVPLEIQSQITYLGADNDFKLLNEDFELPVYYSISMTPDEGYSDMVKNNGTVIAKIENSGRFYLTSKSQPDNDYYGTISFYYSGTIYLKATISPYNEEIRSEKIYEIEIVIDEDNWQFNKKYSVGKQYLQVEMPMINNSGITGESKYAKINLDQVGGGISGTYAQLYDTNNGLVANEVSSLCIDLTKFVSVTYTGNLLSLGSAEHTKFLIFEIESYSVYSPASESYDIFKDTSYNKAQIFYDEETESYFLRIKEVNYNTKIVVSVKTYFGVKTKFTVLAVAPVKSTITSGYSATNQEYVALGMNFDLLSRINISTYNYIYNNEWIGEADLSNSSFREYITKSLVNTGIANETDNSDLTPYIVSKNSTYVTVEQDTTTMLSFKLNLIFDFDGSTENGSQNSQESEWATYYYVRLIPSVTFETNYTGNVVNSNGVVYKNFFIGQTYNFYELDYIVLKRLKLQGTESVVLENGMPVYENKTDEVNLKFETSAFNVSPDGHEVFDGNGARIATIARNDKNYYNIMVVEPSVFESSINTSALLMALRADASIGKISEIYNIRINPLNINITANGTIETYVGTTYNMNDCITIKSETNNDNLSGLNIEYEIPEITESLDNKPTITIDDTGLITIEPYMASDGEGGFRPVPPSRNFNFNVIVSVGTIQKSVQFICGTITPTIISNRTYKTEDVINGTEEQVEYVSMLEGSIIEIKDIAKLYSSITDSNEQVKEVKFSSYRIGTAKYALYNNKEDQRIENINLTLSQSGDNYRIYYRDQMLASLNSTDGKLEATTFLPDDYSLFVSVTCVFNSSYTFELPLRINSIIFNSLLEQTGKNVVTKEGEITKVYLVSSIDDDSTLGTLSGDYITATSKGFITPGTDNQDPFNENGDLALDLSFTVGEMDNVIIQTMGTTNIVYGININGDQREICTISSRGEINVTKRLADSYEFNLEVKFVYSNSTSVYSITTYRIIIIPEYTLVARDESLDYSLENPFEVRLADTTRINLLSSSDGVLILKHVRYNDSDILFNDNKEVSFELVENVNPVIITTEFDAEVIKFSQNDAIPVTQMRLEGNILNLPCAITSDIVIKVTATVTISNSQVTDYYYYFVIKPGVEIEYKVLKKNSKTIGDVMYYNVTTTSSLANDSSVLVLNFNDVIGIGGDTANQTGTVINIDEAYLTDYMGNVLVSEGIRLNGSEIDILNGTSTIATLTYAYENGNRLLKTSYALQKEVYIAFKINVTYRGVTVTFPLNLRFMPRVRVTSTAQNVEIPIIASETYAFSENITMTELDATTFETKTLSDELKAEFIQNIKFRVDNRVDYGFTDVLTTDAALSSVETKTIDIILRNNITPITLFTYNLKIYPLYKFVLEGANSDGQVELFEGQTGLIPNRNVFVYSVQHNGSSYEMLNGAPHYVLNQAETDRVTVEVPQDISNYATVIDSTKVYIKKYSSTPLVINTKLDVSGKFMNYSVDVKTLDIIVEIQRFDNKVVTQENPIVLPAGTNEQILMHSRLTDDTELFFYKLYYKVTAQETKELYYSDSSAYHSVYITDVKSVSGNYAKKQGTTDVVENSENTGIIISFADNKLTVSGQITEKVDVTCMLKIGDETDTTSTMYFTFYPVQMEEIVTLSYINQSGNNFQILANNSGDRILINQFLKINSDYNVNGMNYHPTYDFTSRVKYSFPTDPGVDAISGNFRKTIAGTQDSIQLTPYDNQNNKVTIRLEKDTSGTYLVLDDRLWDTSIQEFELIVKAQIGLLNEYLRFYVSPVAFKYNYAYRASSGTYYYYHSLYADYAYSTSDPYRISNNIDITSLILGESAGVMFELSSAKMNQQTLSVINQNPAPVTDPQMDTINNVVGYVNDAEMYNYAFLKYMSGRYYMSFNVKTKVVTIDGSSYNVPIISETLDIYLTMTKGSIVREIHFEILPYVQMQTSVSDTYERVNNKGTPNDASDDTVDIYDYYLSGTSSKLNYFYNYLLNSCYVGNDSSVKDIRNTKLLRNPVSESVTYEVTSYEKMSLKTNSNDGQYEESPLDVATTLPTTQTMITFADNEIIIDGKLDYVVYLTVKGRASNGYESKFFMKIIPNILFQSIEDVARDADGKDNKTSVGDRFEFIKIEDPNEQFVLNSETTMATVTEKDNTNKIITVSFTRLEEGDAGTEEKTYSGALDMFSDAISIGDRVTINYNPNKPSQLVMGSFAESTAEITLVQNDTVFIKFILIKDEQKEIIETSFVYEGFDIAVGKSVLIKYSTEYPSVVKYAGYLDNTSTFENENAVLTLLTGEEHYLRDCLSAYTPSVANNRIQEYYFEKNATYYTLYAEKTLEYRIMYAWYYSSLTDENNKRIVRMATIGADGNVYVEGEKIISQKDGVLYAESNLAFDVYLNIQGSYEYTQEKVFSDSFYLRIVPTMKFFMIDSSNNQEHEIGKGNTVLAIESTSDTLIKQLDDGTRVINLNEYIKGRKIKTSNGIIEINGAEVSYLADNDSNALVLEYSPLSARVYTIKSEDTSFTEGAQPVMTLLEENGLSFEDGTFRLEKTFNSTCDITLKVSTIIDDVEFSFEVLIQLYRESLIDVAYKGKYKQDDTIIYETIVSGSSSNSNDYHNSIDFNNGYLTPYVWSSAESKYIKDTLASARITAHSICKANSPAGLDRTDIQENIVQFNDSLGKVTAYDEILGDYYFTIQISLNYNGKDNAYTFYFRVLGRYYFETSTLNDVYIDTERIVYNKIIEPEETEGVTKPIYSTLNIMTTAKTNSDGMILIATRTADAAGNIMISYENTFLNGLQLNSSRVESSTGTWQSPVPVENQFTYSYTAPTSSTDKGQIKLAFNDAYYDAVHEIKKSLFITINFTFSYTSNIFSDLYSVQYSIYYQPNSKNS